MWNKFLITALALTILALPLYQVYMQTPKTINRINVIYVDKIIGDNAAGLGVPGTVPDNDYSHIVLAFQLSIGPWDAAMVWSNPLLFIPVDNPYGSTNAEIQQAWIKLYHDQGKKVMLSAFGATEFPTTQGMDAQTTCTNIAQAAKDNHLDGIDLDWEDNTALEAGKGEAWLITCTKAARKILPASEGYVISHAPQAPYFSGSTRYPNGGYLTVHKEVGDLIDFYNVQFYNQGTTKFQTYESCFVKSEGEWLNSSLGEIVANGIPMNKIVFGKPVGRGDVVNTGFLDADTFANFLAEARSQIGYNVGVMGWQFSSDTNGEWIKEVWSKA